MFKYSDLSEVLDRYGSYFQSKYLDKDELINEVWLKNTGQNASTLEEAGYKIYFKMRKLRNRAAVGRKVKFCSYSEKHDPIGDFSWIKVHDDKEELKCLLENSNLSLRDFLILEMYYWEGVTLDEIGSLLFLSPEGVRILRNAAIIKMRNEAIRRGLIKR